MEKKVKTSRKTSPRKGGSASARGGSSASSAKKKRSSKASRPAAKKAAKKVVKKTAKKVAKKVVKKAAKKVVKKAVKKAAKKTAKKVVKKTAKKAAPKRAVGASTARPAKGVTSKSVGSKAPRSATSQDPIQFHEERVKIPKTHLNKKQLDEFKMLLLAKRDELTGDVQHLTRDAFSKGGASAEQSSMPIHMADLGSDNWEHEFTLGLIENEQGRIRMIDDALSRIENRTYGVCLATHKKIGVARLRAKPWAKYCIEYARAREEGRVQ